MSRLLKIMLCVVVALAAAAGPLRASDGVDGGEGELDVNAIINEHLSDNYWWHITTYKETHISLWLPVIVRSRETGWHVFSSRRLGHGGEYEGFRIAGEGKYAGKIVATGAGGEEYRPWDISITKNALALMINSAVMLAIFLGVARWYRRRSERDVPGGFVGAVEMFVMDIEDNVIRKNIGPDYARYSPYLLTAFFFILINNVMGLIPIFPGGANTTGNIAITLAMAVFTAIAVNVFGNRAYWKEILWPDVPMWMKAPVPLMPLIELFGVISKPFALTIRLFANIMAGHAIILGLVSMIFLTVSMGPVINTSMTALSVVMTIFMSLLELLVAYIQAYVFTMLSAVFIGLSRHEPHHKEQTVKTK